MLLQFMVAGFGVGREGGCEGVRVWDVGCWVWGVIGSGGTRGKRRVGIAVEKGERGS